MTQTSGTFWIKVAATTLVAVFLLAVGVVAWRGATVQREATVQRRVQQKISRSAPAGATGQLPRGGSPNVNPTVARQVAQIVAALQPVPNAVPVLMYHYIGDLPVSADKIRVGLTVSSADFSAQLDYLKSKGYSSITTAQLYAALSHGTGASLSPHPVIITFDDGYADTFANAVPILQAHGMVGSFAVITGFVGTRDYASWQQVNAAQASGMEIVSHSFNHINFGSSAYQDSYREWSIAGAQSALAQDAGDRTRTFVYPYGHLTPGTEKILAAHGYTLAFTTTYGLVNLGGGASGSGQDPLALPRVRVSGGEPLDAFALSLNPSALQQATALSKLGAQQQGSAE